MYVFDSTYRSLQTITCVLTLKIHNFLKKQIKNETLICGNKGTVDHREGGCGVEITASAEQRNRERRTERGGKFIFSSRVV